MNSYLDSTRNLFRYYKSLGEKTIDQVAEDKLFWQYNEDSNSIAIIVKHLCGNMLSRWTDFLNSDGEKEWRKREAEFDNDLPNKTALLEKWEEAWACLFKAIDALKEEDLERTIYIRNMGHTVTEAIHRQLGHYAYHVGQIVFIGKMIQGEKWESLSIPKGQSKTYNTKKFAQEKHQEHFTEQFLKDKK